jgi:CheY-like chemotaxis protein
VAIPKILLVDDTRLVLELERSFLKLSHVEVLTAMNGVEALALIRKDPPDLIFMDMNMPEMDGVACCTALKADPFLSSIPVIMLTTAGREGDRERAAKAGCDNFLTKPIDRREFLDMARRYTDAVDRRDLRVPCQFPAIFLMGKSPVGAQVMDVGDGGVFIASHEPVRHGATVRLALYLPEPTPVLRELLGRIAWINVDGKRVNPTLHRDAVAAGLQNGEDGVGCVDLEFVARVQPPQAYVHLPLGYAHLDGLIIEVQKGDLGPRVQPDGRGADVQLGPAVLVRPEMVSGRQRIVQKGWRPFIQAARSK